MMYGYRFLSGMAPTQRRVGAGGEHATFCLAFCVTFCSVFTLPAAASFKASSLFSVSALPALYRWHPFKPAPLQCLQCPPALCLCRQPHGPGAPSASCQRSRTRPTRVSSPRACLARARRHPAGAAYVCAPNPSVAGLVLVAPRQQQRFSGLAQRGVTKTEVARLCPGLRRQQRFSAAWCNQD